MMDEKAISLSPATLRDVPFVNLVRNLSREFLHDQKEYSLLEAVEWWRRGPWPFMIALTISLFVVTYLPILSTWLPDLVMPLR